MPMSVLKRASWCYAAAIFCLCLGLVSLNGFYCNSTFFRESNKFASAVSKPIFRFTVSRPIDAFPETSREAGYCKHEEDVCPSIFLSLDQIWKQLNRTHTTQMSNFVLNIGANDGVNADPLFPLFESHSDIIGGVLLEPGDKFKELKENYKGYKFAYLINDGVSPTNGVELCKRYFDNDSIKRNAPYPTETKTMDVFKIDIDGCDCHVLEEMLKDPFYRAKVIQVETNHHIPPPIAYQDMCKDDVPGRGTKTLDIWGCSVQAAMDIVEKYGYELLQHDWPDAVFLHSSFRETFVPLLGERPDGLTFIRNYYIGYHWAKENYSRFPGHQSNEDLVKSFVEMSTRAYMDPEGVLTELVRICEPLWSKKPLWSKIWIANTQYVVDVQGEEGNLDINFGTVERNLSQGNGRRIIGKPILEVISSDKCLSDVKLPNITITYNSHGAYVYERCAMKTKTVPEGQYGRVALVVSGMVRSFENCAPSHRSFADRHNADIFLHVWAVPGASIEHQFRQLIDLYDPIAMVLEPFDNATENLLKKENAGYPFEHGVERRMNTLSMFYKIYQANSLRIQYEREFGFCYDTVIRARPDLLFESVELSIIDSLKGSNIIYISTSTSDWKEGMDLNPSMGRHSGLGYMPPMDVFAVGNAATMDKYAATYLLIPHIYRSIPLYLFAHQTQLNQFIFWPENILGHSLILQGVEWKWTKFPNQLDSRRHVRRDPSAHMAAIEAIEKYGPTSKEAALAWDIVEKMDTTDSM